MVKKIALPSLQNLVLYLAPLVLIIIPIYSPSEKSMCAFIILLTATYWMFNCVPLSVTGMIPAFLFCATGILSQEEITVKFFFPQLWLFLGVFMLAIAVQTTDLHSRISLKVLITIGTSPHRLLFGFMVTSFSLSMFIANIPVIAMLLPVGEGLVQKFSDSMESAQNDLEDLQHDQREDEEFERDITEMSKNDALVESLKEDKTKLRNGSKDGRQDWKRDLANLSKAVMLAIPYASTIGGVCTLTGSIPNLVAVILIQITFPKSEQISFATWFFYCTPGAIVILIVTYCWMTWLHLGFKRKPATNLLLEKKIHSILKQQYEDLGCVSWAQRWIMVLFIVTTLLWFTRDPGFVSGWGQLFKTDFMTSGTVALGTGLLVFLLPMEKPTLFKKKERTNERKILTFKEFCDKFCWEAMFMAGGGVLMAEGARVSGLSKSMALQLEHLNVLPPWLICLLVCIINCSLTECLSITAISPMLIPILGRLASNIGVHPYYLCVPSHLSSGLSFMLPVASPPNVTAYSFGYFKVKDMVKAGWLMNIIGLVVINISINTYGRVYLGLSHFPWWARAEENITTIFSTGMEATTGEAL